MQTDLEKRTVGSIVYNKYLDTLERTSFDRILDMTTRISVGILVSITLVKAGMIRDALLANDAALLKIAGGMVFGWYSKGILSFSRNLWHEIRTEGKSSPQADEGSVLLDGVDVRKIAGLVFESKGWKRQDAEAIGVGRGSFEKIAKGLEKVGALTRGMANARVLVDGYSLEGLLQVLRNAVTIGEFTAKVDAPLPEEDEAEDFSLQQFTRVAL